MIKTYDFVLTAKYNQDFRAEIDEAIFCHLSKEIFTDIHKLTFLPQSQEVIVTARSGDSIFKNKIPAKRIAYRALVKMLDGEWDKILPGDIVDDDT